MRRSQIKAKLARNEPALITCCHLNDPSVYELTSLMGFDGIWLDMEHHAHSMETANILMRAARVGSADVVARPGKGEFMRMGRMLEAGANAIMYPRCDSPEEAEEVVKWSKFAPLGKRGFDGGNPDMPYCTMPMDEYAKFANEQTFIIIQIEEQHALDQAEQIAKVEGVDALMLGPGDFSMLSEIPGQFDHDKITQANQQVARAAKAAGKHWGRPSGSIEQTQELLDLGARLIFYMADIILIKTGLEKIQQDFTPLGFTFKNQLADNSSSCCNPA